MSSATRAANSVMLARFKTIWADRVPIAWPNVAFNPPSSGEWVKFDVQWGDGEPVSMGTNKRNTIVGVVFVNVFGKPGTARGNLLALADAVRDIFNRIEVSGVRFNVPSGPTPVSGNPEWEQLVIKTAFTVDELT